jgi:hypothetical protein
VKEAAERTAIVINTMTISRSSSRTGLEPPNEKMITTDLTPKSIRSNRLPPLRSFGIGRTGWGFEFGVVSSKPKVSQEGRTSTKCQLKGIHR